MSNMNQTSMEPMAPAPEMLPPATAPEGAKKVKKSVFNILIALIAVAIGAAALFVPIDGYAGKMPFECLEASSALGYGVFFLIAGAAVALVLAILTLFAKNSDGFARFAALAAASGVAAQSLFSAICLGGELDLIPLAMTGAGAVLYFVITIKQLGKEVFANFIHLVFAWIFFAVFALAASDATAVIKILEAGDDMILVVAIAIALISLIWASAALGVCNDRIGSIVRGVLELLAAIVFCYAAFSAHSDKLIALLPAIIALVHLIVITLIILLFTNKRVEKAKDELHRTFSVEEYAEAYPYEGGPVAGVQMAEEVNPTFRPLAPHINTAGYDFYNSKSFDPFIATLNTEERNQFTEIFILKFKGTMNELPDYVVGGDNKEFFRKIFIYLGQYRDRIPSELLVKMYQFSIKLS